ncbi:MAG: GWxTD domain-containing protein [Melioribacter sp.]|nr:GWxTD domain-containing protein [Melioribacter sp.]
MKILFSFATLIFLHVSFILDTISANSNPTELNQKAKKFLELKDTLTAEKYFLKSIRKYNDADSYYELAKIYLNKNTFTSRNRAHEYLKKATLLEPKNIQYRFLYASLLKDLARLSAYQEFKEILSVDSTHIPSLLSIAELKSKDFAEYNNSVRKLSDEFYASLQQYANEDFYEAEKYFLKVLKLDSLNYEAILKLSLLYENAGYFEKAIYYLNKLKKIKNEDANIHLYLGLLYYKTSKLSESYNEYKKALALMDEKEKEDFTFNTVKFLLEPAFDNVIKEMSKTELKSFINTYWKFFDPLYLTDYNERILEHYSRVVYSNLHFGVPKLGLRGWQTNRGEIVLRYGEPLNYVRIRPQMGESGFMMKTEVWDYKDMSFGFTDMTSSGKFLFSVPSYEKDKVHSQFVGNSLEFITYLRTVKHATYEPKYEGPKFDVDFSISQFKSSEMWYKTDLYVNYLIDIPDSLFEKTETVKHKIGIFFFDNNYDEQFRKIDSIDIKKEQSKNYFNSLLITSYPDTGFASFEIIRDIDKGVFSNRFKFRIKRFNNIEFGLSDILISKKVTTQKISGIKRGNIYLSVDPLNRFYKSDSIYLYFEIYNLRRNEKGICDYEQKISIKKYIEKPTNQVAKFVKRLFGLDINEEVSVITNYKNYNNNPITLLKLNLDGYLKGKYLITVTIKDNLSKEEQSSSQVIEIIE